jgi:hypothetical protein
VFQRCNGVGKRVLGLVAPNANDGRSKGPRTLCDRLSNCSEPDDQPLGPNDLPVGEVAPFTRALSGASICATLKDIEDAGQHVLGNCHRLTMAVCEPHTPLEQFVEEGVIDAS